jgi:glycosyltransferase involved in cell wall biosynthesis
MTTPASPAQPVRPTLSAIVITKNEERAIRRCLESVAWADEIVVVDSGSTDRTPEICRELGVRFHATEEWPGYGPQKNRALRAATSEWVFSIDADEWVTPELRAEIEHALRKNDRADGYALPRRSSFCGRFMQHSGWWPDYVVRLFRRNAGHFSDDPAHERVIVTGKVARLREPLMHEAILNLEQMIAKMDAYSTATAQMKFARGERSTLLSALLHGVWTFVRTYLLRLGFLDGREGFMLAVANAEGSYYRYLKLMLMAKRP